MDKVIANRINGKNGGLKRIENEIIKENSLEATLEPPLKPTLEAKLIEDNKVNETNKNNIDERKLKFASTLEPFLKKYGREMLNAFYKYWTEPNKSNTKFRQEGEKFWDLSKRLATWHSKQKVEPIRNPEPTDKPIELLNGK